MADVMDSIWSFYLQRSGSNPGLRTNGVRRIMVVVSPCHGEGGVRIPRIPRMGWHVPRLAMLPCKEREVDSISTRSTNARRSLTLKRLASNQETGLNSHGAL